MYINHNAEGTFDLAKLHSCYLHSMYKLQKCIGGPMGSGQLVQPLQHQLKIITNDALETEETERSSNKKNTFEISAHQRAYASTHSK